MDNWLGWAAGAWLGWVSSTPAPVTPTVHRQQPTHDKYYVSRQSKYNVYIPDDISLEEALLLWWKIINE
jgi:hypothetical protein